MVNYLLVICLIASCFVFVAGLALYNKKKKTNKL